MDDIDRTLIRLLRQDARAPFIRLAEAVGTSEGTVRARVKRLVDEGVIRRFTIQTAGSQVKALVEVKVLQNVHTSSIAADIRSWENVEAVWEVTGDNDIIVVADCPSTADLNAIIDRIRDVEGTDATRSRLILKEH